jgi:hypothetical protein
MKRKMKRILLLFILLVCIPIASAYTVSSITVNPSGDLTPGTPVTASFTIQLAGSGGYTFDSESTLDLLTELDNPRWNAVLVLNNIDNPQQLDNKKNVYLSGYVLSYPSSDVKENLRVTLQGVAPTVTSTTIKTVVQIQELDSRNNVVSDSMVTVSRRVINIAEVTKLIAIRKSDLQIFRTHIDEKEAMGIDTSTAEAKYSAALAAINDALSTPSSQYAAAYASLTNAQNLIIEGEKLLDEAWAEKVVRTTLATTSVPTPLLTTQFPVTIALTTTTVPTIIPTTELTTFLTTTTPDPVIKLLEEQNKKIEEQNQLIAEQNKKLAEQSGILDQILNYFKRIFGWN